MSDSSYSKLESLGLLHEEEDSIEHHITIPSQFSTFRNHFHCPILAVSLVLNGFLTIALVLTISLNGSTPPFNPALSEYGKLKCHYLFAYQKTD
jgi:hypothetical protein